MQFYGIIILLLLNINEGFCNASFYKEKARGWHWYETKKDAISDNNTRKSPTQMVDEIRNDTETKLHKALIEPTESNIIEYIKAQEKVSDKSEKFARIWQKVIYKNPSLDRTLRYPVSNNALHISRYEELEQKRNKIRSLSKEYGLMYFFSGDCKYCIGFSSVVKNFAKFYDWELMPIQIGDLSFCLLTCYLVVLIYCSQNLQQLLVFLLVL